MLKKVIDVKEAKEQILFSFPMILTNVFYNLIPMISVMFAGHFGELPLAGSTLVNSWATVTGYAFMGPAVATFTTFWLSVIILITYVSFANKFEHTWKGLSTESFLHVFSNLKLALPSAAMVRFEYWAFEILVLLAGLMADSEATTSLMAICTRVSNLLGAGKPSQAKSAMGVTIKLSILLAMIISLALGLGRYIWGSFFSDNASIIKAFAALTPWICLSILLDSIQGVLSGVCRGCGWQHFAVFINLGTFYFIGMPIAYLTAFEFNLHVKGLWIGLICGLTIQSASLFLITRFHKWTALDISSRGNANSVRAEPV
uniref:Uncharacterized protein n=1 Tax=Chenopodium quinoa TaxID=63459 RepID=A0A803N4F9_CHEQI